MTRHLPRRLAAITVLALSLGLAACASTSEARLPELPADTVSATRTEANGDVITEYRSGGQLLMVHVKPVRGPEYYLYSRDGKPGGSRDDAPQTYFKLFGW
ncbi:MAG: DUF2782 domain-containing protein [Pseudoxanthomonas suwonensis]|nr:DUF2782 domain-containing protein [Pseudoxanthomonas suwonensis]